MRILVVNDDGIRAEGIRALVNEMKKIGKVTVVAPAEHMSGAGHSLSISKILKAEKMAFDEDVEGYAVYGSPRDCAELGINAIISEPIDLIVSGINQGSNLSNNIPCSGTCGAACTGLDYDVPAIAVSLDFGDDYDYRYSAQIARKMAQWFVQQPFKHDFVLNINVPNRPEDQIKGYKICGWGGDYVYHQNLTPTFDGQYYYFDTTTSHFTFRNMVEDLSGDIKALHEGYITVSPITLDMVRYEKVDLLKAHLPEFKL